MQVHNWSLELTKINHQSNGLYMEAYTILKNGDYFEIFETPSLLYNHMTHYAKTFNFAQ